MVQHARISIRPWSFSPVRVGSVAKPWDGVCSPCLAGICLHMPLIIWERQHVIGRVVAPSGSPWHPLSPGSRATPVPPTAWNGRDVVRFGLHWALAYHQMSSTRPPFGHATAAPVAHPAPPPAPRAAYTPRPTD